MVTMVRIAVFRVDIQTMDKNVSRNVHVFFRTVITSEDVKTKQVLTFKNYMLLYPLNRIANRFILLINMLVCDLKNSCDAKYFK